MIAVSPVSDPIAPTSAATPPRSLEYGRPDAGTEARPTELGRSTVSGSLWTLGSYVAVSVIRLASNLIVAQMLVPQFFGIALIVTTIMVGIRLFSDVGIGPAIISNRRGEHEPFLRTAFTVQILRGFGIWLAAAAIAVPAAHYYARQDPALGAIAYLLPVAGFVAVIEGLRSTAVFRLQRRLRFAEQSLLDVIELAVTGVCMVTWASLSPTVWALVLSPLAGSFAAMIVSHVLMRDRSDRPGWDGDCARELMRVGRWIFVSTLLTFLANQVDRLMFGRLIDTHMLGVYSVAVGLSIMPTIAVMKLGNSVLFSTLARVAGDAPRFASVYRRSRTMLLATAALIVSGMIACAPFAIRAMYKPDFEDAGWILQLLAVCAWFQIVDATNGAALLARQHSHWMAVGNLVKVVALFIAVPIGFHYYGLAGAVVALAAADGLRAITSTVAMQRLGVPRRALLPDFAYPLAIAAIGLAALVLANWLEPHVEALFTAGKFHRLLVNATLTMLAGIVVVAIWMPVCAWQWKRLRHTAA